MVRLPPGSGRRFWSGVVAGTVVILTLHGDASVPELEGGSWPWNAGLGGTGAGAGCTDIGYQATDSRDYPCRYYVENAPHEVHAGWCSNYDDSDFTAASMCCFCGGGKKAACVDTDPYTGPAQLRSCRLASTITKLEELCGGYWDGADLTATEMCCVCGGGVVNDDTDVRCVDTNPWYKNDLIDWQSHGYSTFTWVCDIYQVFSSYCTNPQLDNSVFTASDMCCSCGGGKELECIDPTEDGGTYGNPSRSNCPGSLEAVICPWVQKIPDNAFIGCPSLEEVVIPVSVTDIGEYAFFDCSQLAKVRILGYHASIGKYAFAHCSSLFSLGFPSTPYRPATVSLGAFCYVGSLGDFMELQVFSWEGWGGCDQLLSYGQCMDTNGEGLDSLGGSCDVYSIDRMWCHHYDDSDFTSVDMCCGCGGVAVKACPKECFTAGLADSGEPCTTVVNAFGGCVSHSGEGINCSACVLERQHQPCPSQCSSNNNGELCTRWVSVWNWCGDGEIYNYRGTDCSECIVQGACADIDNGTVDYLGAACSAYATFPSWCDLTDDSDFTSADMCCACGGGAEAHVPPPPPASTAACIDSATFADGGTHDNPTRANCPSSNVIVICSGATEIPDSAFSGCTSLTTVTIPDSVTSIGKHAFYSCHSLAEVTLGISVTSIGDEAFCNCDSLVEVVIPDSVTRAWESAFPYCDSSAETGVQPPLVSTGFEYVNLQSLFTSPGALTKTASTDWSVAFDTRTSIVAEGPGPRGISFKCPCTNNRVIVGLKQAAGEPSAPQTWSATHSEDFTSMYDSITDNSHLRNYEWEYHGFDVGFSCMNGTLYAHFGCDPVEQHLGAQRAGDTLSLVVDNSSITWYVGGVLVKKESELKACGLGQGSSTQSPLWVVAAINFSQSQARCSNPHLQDLQFISAHSTPSFCLGDHGTFDAGFGTCDTYAHANHGSCNYDHDGLYSASQVCQECGQCERVACPATVMVSGCSLHEEKMGTYSMVNLSESGHPVYMYQNQSTVSFFLSWSERGARWQISEGGTDGYDITIKSTTVEKYGCPTGVPAKKWLALSGNEWRECDMSVLAQVPSCWYHMQFQGQTLNCDTAWVHYEWTCEVLGGYSWDCRGCACPGDGLGDSDCANTDYLALDTANWDCVMYSLYPSQCHRNDDSDFTSADMCCACGGGTGATCTDTANGKTDSYRDPCSYYSLYGADCHKYDDSDFTSADMCCACGGGCTELHEACSEYHIHPSACGADDNDFFTSADMCCACMESCQAGPEFQCRPSVVICQGVTDIPAEAFKNCDILTEVRIPDSVRNIHRSAFEGCGNLVRLRIPNALENIGDRAFYACEGIRRLTIPDSVSSIGTHAFGQCFSLREVRMGLAVTIISPYLFYQCGSLVHVTLGSATTEIGDLAFAHCHLLESVHIPGTVRQIGEEAFRECHSLRQLAIPSTVTFLGDGMCRGCESLEMLSVGSPVQERAFVDDFSPEVGLSEIPYLFCSRCTSLVSVIVHGSTVTEVGKQAFEYCTSLERVVLPDGVKRIKSHAFYDCVRLAELRFGRKVEYIGDWAFKGCQSLKMIPKLGEEQRMTIGIRAFAQCTSLERVNVGDFVTSVGNEAFQSCTKLVHVVLGRSMKLDTNVFGGCCRITRVHSSINRAVNEVFPECARVKSITIRAGGLDRNSLSGGCDHLATLHINAQEVLSRAWEGCTALTALQLSNNVKSIADNAFVGCTKLPSVSLPSSIMRIGHNVFQGCTALKRVELSSDLEFIGRRVFDDCPSLEKAVVQLPLSGAKGIHEVFNCSKNLSFVEVKLDESTTDIMDSALEKCGSVISVTVASGAVKRIGQRSFFGCKNLRNVSLGSQVEKIGDRAFEGCESLAEAIMADSPVDEIGARAFYGCASLSVVSMPQIESIGESAFYGCSSLSDVNLGSNLTWIGASAFAHCSSLSSIDIPPDIDTIAESAFHGCRSLVNVEVLGHVRSIKRNAFRECSGLLSAPIGDSVIEIGRDAFRGCSSLRDVTLPDSLSSIADYSFAGCLELISIQFSMLVATIGKSSFEGCSNLTSLAGRRPGQSMEARTVDLSTLRQIGDDAFKDCTSLATVVLMPDGVIGNNAFSGTTKLSTVYWSPPLPSGADLALPAFASRIRLCLWGERSDRHGGCIKCDPELICSGGREDEEIVQVKEGFMTLFKDRFSVYDCQKGRCPGNRDVKPWGSSMCPEHVDESEAQCSVCTRGAFLNRQKECELCPDVFGGLEVLKIILTLLFQLAVSAQLYKRVNRPKTSAESTVSSIITFIQTMHTLSRLDLQFPKTLVGFFDFLNFMELSGTMHQLQFKTECLNQSLSPLSFKLANQGLSPLIILVNMAVLQGLLMLFKKSLNRNFVMNLVGLVYTGLFLTLVRLSLSLFFSKRMPNGKHMVVDYPELEIGSPAWINVLPINLASTLAYGVTTLTYVARAVWTAPRRAGTEPGFLARYRFCFGTKRPDRWWWILMPLAFGVGLNGLQVIMPADNVQSKIYTSFACVVLFTTAMASAWPDKFAINTIVEMLLKGAVGTFLLFATAFVEQESLPKHVEELWAFIVVFVLVGALSVATFALIRDSCSYLQPVNKANVKKSTIYWQLRDVALAMLMLPDAEFASRVHSVSDSDRSILERATKGIINVVFGQQSSNGWWHQRLIPGKAYKVWSRADVVQRIVEEPYAGNCGTALERTGHLRQKIIEMASAMYGDTLENVVERVASGISGTSHAGTVRISEQVRKQFRKNASTAEPAVGHRFSAVVDRVSARSSKKISGRQYTIVDRIMQCLGMTPVPGMTEDEFVNMLLDMRGLKISEEDALSIFGVLDSNKSGDMSAEELTALLSALAPPELVAELKDRGWEPEETFEGDFDIRRSYDDLHDDDGDGQGYDEEPASDPESNPTAQKTASAGVASARAQAARMDDGEPLHAI